MYSSRSRASSNDFSNVQVLDGGDAFISTGVEVPVQTSSVVSDGDVRVAAESTEYRKVATGLYVRSRLIANEAEVLMEIAPSRAALASSPTHRNATPAIREQRIVTTVRGRIGEWLPLAANSRVRTASGNALIRSSGHLREADPQIFVKVEIVR